LFFCSLSCPSTYPVAIYSLVNSHSLPFNHIPAANCKSFIFVLYHLLLSLRIPISRPSHDTISRSVYFKPWGRRVWEASTAAQPSRRVSGSNTKQFHWHTAHDPTITSAYPQTLRNSPALPALSLSFTVLIHDLEGVHKRCLLLFTRTNGEIGRGRGRAQGPQYATFRRDWFESDGLGSDLRL